MAKSRKLANVPKVFIADSARYDIPVAEFGQEVFDRNYFLRNPFDNFRLVVLTGGEDISPGLYGHLEAKECAYTNPERDAKDLIVYQTAVACGIPVVGICRGAQLVCVLNGGSLCQHTTGHTVWHDMCTSDGRSFQVSSTHHQMMLAHPNAEILGWSAQRQSTTYIGARFEGPIQSIGELDPPARELEVIFHPDMNALAVQYHPEYMSSQTPGFRYFKRLLVEKLGLAPADRDQQDFFVSLPKQALTQAGIDSETEAIARMSEKERQVFLARKYKADFISSRVRYLRSLFWTEAEALADAIAEYRKWSKLVMRNQPAVSQKTTTTN